MKRTILLLLALITPPALAQKHGPGNGPGHSPLYPHRPYPSTVRSGWSGNGRHDGGIYREGHLLSTKHGRH